MSESGNIRVVAAVVERGGCYLLCQRPLDKRHGGLWEFPGGKLEPGEGIAAAATRELAEELGVRAWTTGGQLFAVLDPGSAFLIEFHPVAIEGEPVCLEHAALAWVEPAAMAGLALAPSDRKFAEFLAGRRL